MKAGALLSALALLPQASPFLAHNLGFLFLKMENKEACPLGCMKTKLRFIALWTGDLAHGRVSAHALTMTVTPMSSETRPI